MRIKGLSWFEILVSIVNWGCIPLFIVYVVCMVIFPIFQGPCGARWAYVQAVWDNWQTLNAGILAFFASVIAFNISKYQENKQRERKFIAARAFLPHALSELMGYFKQSAKVLLESWDRLEPQPTGPVVLAEKLPQLPGSYKETFSHCIEHAEANVGDYLASILVRLQMHHSRLVGLYNSLTTESQMIEFRENVMVYLYRLAELHASVGHLFQFARAEKAFDGSPPTWEDYASAFSNLDIYLEHINGLEDFTKRRISKAAAASGF